MSDIKLATVRRTSVDEVFDYLHAEITSLRLLPGDKISEAEIAARFGVSRQPVRDAFSRLANLDLLLIRPQRATEVKRFSNREITKSRFMRSAIEVEVVRRAVEAKNPDSEARLKANLGEQAIAVKADDFAQFSQLDYEFHKIICELAGTDYAFEIIQEEKAKVDRLCLLSLSKEDRMPELLEDHTIIANGIINGNADEAVATCKKHLGRLDDTIISIEERNARYFTQ